MSSKSPRCSSGAAQISLGSRSSAAQGTLRPEPPSIEPAMPCWDVPTRGDARLRRRPTPARSATTGEPSIVRRSRSASSGVRGHRQRRIGGPFLEAAVVDAHGCVSRSLEVEGDDRRRDRATSIEHNPFTIQQTGSIEDRAGLVIGDERRRRLSDQLGIRNVLSSGDVARARVIDPFPRERCLG